MKTFFTCDLCFFLVALMSFQKSDVAPASKYLLCESTIAGIFPNALILLHFLQNFVSLSFLFRKGKGIYIEVDSRGDLDSIYVFYFKQPVDSKPRMLQTLTRHPCSVSP